MGEGDKFVDYGAIIGGVLGLSILFFSCGIALYCLGSYLLRDDGRKTKKKPPLVEAWDAKHYYDPQPSALSPPEVLCQPSIYSFKIHNGNPPHSHPHAVINPAVLQFPPGHVMEEKQTLTFGSGRASSKVSPTSNKSQNALLTDTRKTSAHSRERQRWFP